MLLEVVGLGGFDARGECREGGDCWAVAGGVHFYFFYFFFYFVLMMDYDGHCIDAYLHSCTWISWHGHTVRI